MRRRNRNIFDITNEFGVHDDLFAPDLEQGVDLFGATELPNHNANGAPRDAIRLRSAPNVASDRRSRFGLIACSALVACTLLVGLTAAGKEGPRTAPDSRLGHSTPNAVRPPERVRPDRPQAAESRAPSRPRGGVVTPRLEQISSERRSPAPPSGSPAAPRQVKPQPSARAADLLGHEFSFER